MLSAASDDGQVLCRGGSEEGVLNDIWTGSNTCSLQRDICGDDLHLGFLESKMFGQAKFGAI